MRSWSLRTYALLSPKKKLMPSFLIFQVIRPLGQMALMCFFGKKAWHIIREEFYKLCSDFYNHTAALKSINHSYITLVPKKDNPENITDFRPISLLNTSLKIITKILANRL